MEKVSSMWVRHALGPKQAKVYNPRKSTADHAASVKKQLMIRQDEREFKLGGGMGK